MSDAVLIQIISSLAVIVVTVLGLLFHRMHGSKENQKIQTNLNGDRKVMLDRMDDMQKEIARLTGANIQLESDKINEASVIPNRLSTIVQKLLADVRAGSVRIPNILVIEDNLADRELMRLSIELVGGNAICVNTGEKGLEILAANVSTIDMVFLDMNLPGMDGVMVIKRIREISTHVPVVFVTGSLSPQAIEEATKHGSVSMLVKPLERANLREILFQHRIPFRDPEPPETDPK